MKTKEIFIVNSEQGTQVITANVLAKEIKKELKNNSVKRRDIEVFAEEAVRANSGKAIDIEDHKVAIERYCNALVEFSELTPYKYFEKSETL